MPEPTFKALLLTQDEGKTHADITTLHTDDLPEGDVLVRVMYSDLNFKDGLAVTGAGKIVRSFPFVPGVDFVGTVEQSESADYKPGDTVVLTGWGVGEKHWGGYAQMARGKSDWLVPLPDNFSPQQAMGIGTAGFAAMLAVMALESHGCAPDSGEVVVTGASGGVGSIAVAILGNLGYSVVASTGKTYLADYLKSLGAAEIMHRDELARASKPMESSRWAGAIDNVGGDTLATLLATMSPGGSIASVGLAGSHELHTTVYPLILRGVNLLGVDSTMTPREKRLAVWDSLARELPLRLLDDMIQIIPLDEVPAASEKIVAGDVHGRVVVDINQ